MTSSLKEAFLKAGIKKATDMTEKRMTQLERIWRFVNDHPGCTLREVHSVLKFKATAQGLNSLLARGMVKVTKEERKGYGPYGTAKVINLYRVAFPDFEVLPLPPKAKRAGSKQVTTNPLKPKWRAEPDKHAAVGLLAQQADIAAEASAQAADSAAKAGVPAFMLPNFKPAMPESAKVVVAEALTLEEEVDTWDVAKARTVFQHLKKSFS